MRALLTLADVASHLTHIEVACSRCDRRGRLSVPRLLERHGPDAPLRVVTAGLNDGCPRRHAIGAGLACDLYHPGLAEAVLGSAAAHPGGRPQ